MSFVGSDSSAYWELACRAGCGGLEFSQTAYCQLMEVLGGHCGSTALFVNAPIPSGRARSCCLAHLSSKKHICRSWPLAKPLALLLSPSLTPVVTPPTCKRGQLPPPMARGSWLNGQKRWITNGGISQVLTVMRAPPVADSDETKITAFIVHALTCPASKSWRSECRSAACGVRLHRDWPSRYVRAAREHPRSVGVRIKIALTVLDFGRTTFGASCTGAAKFCLRARTQHANQRVQFGETLGSFELVKDKLAYMAAGAFAMESVTSNSRRSSTRGKKTTCSRPPC